eukprot:252230-Rhodomonas_salina.3
MSFVAAPAPRTLPRAPRGAATVCCNVLVTRVLNDGKRLRACYAVVCTDLRYAATVPTLAPRQPLALFPSQSA